MRWLNRLLDLRARPTQGRYAPHFPRRVDRDVLVRDTAWILELPVETVRTLYREYRRFYRHQGYAHRLGERKTTCFEEAFVLFCGIHRIHPRTVVEIGTQYGKSTRRILDMLKLLDIDASVTCFDVATAVRFFAPHEATLMLRDVTGHFKEEVLDSIQPDFIFLDAHPYDLLKDVIASYLLYARRSLLAVHDCSRGLCNPHMSLGKDDLSISSATGLWERHVLAEAFGIPDPLDERLDRLETTTHRLRVFETPHGLALIARRDSAAPGTQAARGEP